MRKKHFRLAAIAAFAGMLGLAFSSAFAGRIERNLLIPKGDGTFENSFWTASWDEAAGFDLDVQTDPITGQNFVVIEKKITFRAEDLRDGQGDPDRFAIFFNQTSFQAKDLIVMNSEFIQNDTGRPWSGFMMWLMDGSGTSDTHSQFIPELSANFSSGSIFPNLSFSNDNQMALMTANPGDTLPSFDPNDPAASIFQPGVGVNKDLWINAAPTKSGYFQSFVLKEAPVIAIPLPAAAWTGLSGLIGLGLLGSLKKVRSLRA